jgi:hypothetical protein
LSNVENCPLLTPNVVLTRRQLNVCPISQQRPETPPRLRDAGVSQEVLAQVAEAAVEDGTIVYNPREVVAEEILKPLENAY